MSTLPRGVDHGHKAALDAQVVIVTADRKFAEELCGELGPMVRTEVVDSIEKLSAQSLVSPLKDPQFFFVDTANPLAMSPQRWASLAKLHNAVFCHWGDVDDAIELWGKYPHVRHVHGVATGEQLDLLRRLSLVRRPRPLVQSYLAPDAVVHSHQLTSYKSGMPCLDVLAERMASVTRIPDFAAAVRMCAWELLSNAFFDAPIDGKTGQRRHLDKRKSEEVLLGDGEEVLLSYGIDGQNFVLSVSDPFGSLSPEKLLSGLLRCRRKGLDQVGMTPKGAGIGLYMILDFAARLEFHVKKSFSTEVLMAVPINVSPRELAMRPRSLHFYQVEES